MFFFSFLSNILLAFNECSDWELFRWRRCLLFIESVKYLDSRFSSLSNCKYDRSKFFLKVKKKNPKSCNMTYHTCFCIFPPNYQRMFFMKFHGFKKQPSTSTPPGLPGHKLEGKWEKQILSREQWWKRNGLVSEWRIFQMLQ